MSNLYAQQIIGAHDAGAVGISDRVFHVVGQAATMLEWPADLRGELLILIAAKGNFLMRLGALGDADFYEGIYPTESDTTEGNGAVLIKSGQSLVLPAPEKLTVRGDADNSVLTFFWL